MRIDKYLWFVRLFKTRSQATEHVRGERVHINNEVSKASREVRVGDHLVVKRHGFEQHFTILSLPKSRIGAKLVNEYLEEITPQEELDKKAFLQMARTMSRAKGLGRPTKKDRRDLDKLR
jgi:ribosome-associated heat shock protein Hsp15